MIGVLRVPGRAGSVWLACMVVVLVGLWAPVPVGDGLGLARAEVKHSLEGSFNGSDAPEQFLPAALADAVDNSGGPSSGDVYVATFSSVEKFDAEGKYAGVSITGAETPQGAFSLISFETFGTSKIAVDGSTGPHAGDLYVSDIEHGVVDRFSENGVFECQITGKTPVSPQEIEDECAGAVGSATPNGSIVPTGVTVEASTGDVYVADVAHAAIDRFSATGAYLEQIVDPHIMTPGPIALDGNGDLYVANTGPFFVFVGPVVASNVVTFHEGSFVSVLDAGEPLSVTVDPVNEHVYVFDAEQSETKQHELVEYDTTGRLIDHFGQAGHIFAVESVAASNSDKLYAAQADIGPGEPGEVFVFGPDVVVPTAMTGLASEVGVTSAVLSGSVDPDAMDGGGQVTGCVFEYVTDAAFVAHGYEGASSVPCEPGLPYASFTAVKATVAVLASTRYHFRVAAHNSNAVNGDGEDETFRTIGPPVVEGESPRTLSATAATLAGEINPSGFDTTCRMEYVGQTAFEASGYATAISVACSPVDLGEGATTQTATVALTGLRLNSSYHYRFVAVNSSGTTTGADEVFSTFGVKAFAFEVLDKEKHAYTQAGGHPYEWNVELDLNTPPAGTPQGVVANPKDVITELPSGLIADPSVIAKCTPSDLSFGQCSGASQVGTLDVEDSSHTLNETVGVYNLTPPAGVPVEFGAVVGNFVRVYIKANVRTGGDYGATATIINTSQQDGITGATLKMWGVPADPSHESERICPVVGSLVGSKPCPVSEPIKAFLVNPTSCGGPLTATVKVDSWQEPGSYATATSTIPAFTGCEQLDFTPSVSVRPDTTVADSPSGLSFDLKVPQSQSVAGFAEANLKQTVLSFPAGVSVSPSAANGLQACSPAQIGLDTTSPAACPDASKVGSVEVVSPLLEDHLTGGVYVAEQSNNPFGSLLAVYLTAEADGAVVKLAGHIVADPVTGQLTTTFDNNPQLPFSDLKVNLTGGPRAALATPENCGSYPIKTALAPWSATPAVDLEEAFPINAGCATSFNPALIAYSSRPRAGGFTPFVLSFSRSDTDQELSKLAVTLPPGLLAKLAGVPLCPDAQANTGDCPEASQVGTVQAGAGPGADPIFVPGRVYLTGPYKGAPYGETVVIPAIAGPFNLGDVVVRGTVQINPVTGQATVTSDPFPTILQGIPIRLRQTIVTLERPAFVFNPTSCAPMSINATLTSTSGTLAPVSEPFQAGNCASLAFKPHFTASTKGTGTKANGASLTVKMATRQGPQSATAEANIRKVEVQLPKALPSRLSTLQKACTEQQFVVNPAGCPPASLVGHAVAHSPALPDPLQGPAYIVSHGGAAFPDLVLVLQGDNVTIELTGHTKITKGITYSRFETVPDAPVTSFELQLPTGHNSILAAYGNLCSKKTTLKMPTTITAQNGLILKQTTNITNTNCPKPPHKHTTKHHTTKHHTTKPKHK